MTLHTMYLIMYLFGITTGITLVVALQALWHKCQINKGAL